MNSAEAAPRATDAAAASALGQVGGGLDLGENLAEVLTNSPDHHNHQQLHQQQQQLSVTMRPPQQQQQGQDGPAPAGGGVPELQKAFAGLKMVKVKRSLILLTVC